MSAKFITGILTIAATVATFSAAPARAGGDADKVAKIIAGAATLYIAGQLINELAGNATVVEVHGKHKADDSRGRGRDQGRSGNRYNPRHGGHWTGKSSRRVLPGSCIRRIPSRHARYALGSGCLQRNDVSLRRIPRACQVTWPTRSGNRSGYALGCLKRSGYKIAYRW